MTISCENGYSTHIAHPRPEKHPATHITGKIVLASLENETPEVRAIVIARLGKFSFVPTVQSFNEMIKSARMS